MLGIIRVIGIAIGSLVAAALVVGFLAPFVPGFVPPESQPLLAIVLGGLVFADIMARHHPASGPPTTAS